MAAEAITINNSDILAVDRTELMDDVSSGDTTLQVVNSGQATDDHFALIGGFGNESSELRHITAVNADSLSVSSLSRAHQSGTAIVVLPVDKLRIYAADSTSTPDDELFERISEIDITVDSVQTVYVNQEGGATIWYKVTQFNSVTNVESDLADAVVIRGGGTGDYASLADIRAEAGFEEAENLPDAVVSRYRRRAQALIHRKLRRYYVVPFNPVPDEIREITTLAAAGYLLLKEYGSLEEGTNKEGGAKLGEAKEWLNDIYGAAEAGLSYLEDAVLVAISADGGISGWPDETTSDADVHTEAGDKGASFKIGERF